MSSEVESTGEKGEKQKSRRVGYIVLLMVLLVAIVAGGVSHSAGVGVFGYRMLLHGESELYVLNLEDEARFVAVDGGDITEVPAQGARLIPIVGGRLTVTAADEAGGRRGQWEIEVSRSDVLLNLSQDNCVVISELTGISAAEEIEVDIIEGLQAETEIYAVNSRNVVWPRGYPGAVAESEERALSVEIVECWLLDEADFLQDYLRSQMRQRLQ